MNERRKHWTEWTAKRLSGNTEIDKETINFALNNFASEYHTKQLRLGVVVRQSEQLVYPCKVCGKPFGDNLSLYMHYDEEHN